MRILSICYEDMGGNIGGVRQVIEISRSLSKLGYQVEVVAPGIRNFNKEVPFKIHYVPVIQKKLLRPLTYHLLLLFYLIRVCYKFRPDIVLTYEIFLSFVPLLVAKIFSLPYVMFVNGDTEDFKLQGMPGFILGAIELIRKINFGFCDTIFTVTENLRGMLIKKYNYPGNKIIIVNNGVDTDFFKPMDKGGACKSVGLDPNYFYVGFLGGIWPWHGLDLLIESAPLVLKAMPEIKFVIAGHGPDKSKLNNLIKGMGIEKSFLVRDEVDFDKVPAYINAFDVCIVFFKPVRKNQGSPIKLFEYLACGKPVIATNIENYGLLLEKYGGGISVNSEDPARVAEAILKLAQDEKLRQRTGEDARKAAVVNFSWRKVAESVALQLKGCLVK